MKQDDQVNDRPVAMIKPQDGHLEHDTILPQVFSLHPATRQSLLQLY
jgi:hypothetical protein